MPVTTSRQEWSIGSIVKVGFLHLRVDALEPTPGDYMPDRYLLTDERTGRRYAFVPHYGLERID